MNNSTTQTFGLSKITKILILLVKMQDIYNVTKDLYLQ